MSLKRSFCAQNKPFNEFPSYLYSYALIISQMEEEKNIEFQTIDWSGIAEIEYKGETGAAMWKTVQFPGLRIRLVEYSKRYLADHWCRKRHIVHCLEGEFISGVKSLIKKSMTYVVSDELSTHRSFTENGMKVLIIDGDFLKLK